MLVDFNTYTHIILNGNILGYHKNPKYLFNILKKLKRKGVINIYTSISWNYQENKIYLNSESGRAIRPTYIVDNIKNKNYLRFNKKDILEILNNNINFIKLFDLDNDNLNQKQKYGDLKKKYKNLKKEKRFSVKDIKTSPNVLICLICVVITELSVIIIFYK